MSTRAPYLDLHGGASTAMLDHEVTNHLAWTRDTVSVQDWTVPLPSAAIDEILLLTDTLARHPQPIQNLSPEQFTLAECRKAMARTKTILQDGIGVALVDKLPLDQLSKEQAIAAHWVLGQLLSRPVAQTWDNAMIYDITDTGLRAAYGVRGAWTNNKLTFHTDNAFGLLPPDYVALCCLMTAQSGGVSRFCSLYTLHNEMRRRYPRQLERLYQPMYFDRQGEHAPDAPKVSWAPCLRYQNGQLSARFSPMLVHKGYALMETPFDAETQDAFSALRDVLSEKRLWIEFTIQSGQLQYLNNREIAHSRSEFQDDEAHKRHLVRLWFREEGGRCYDG